MRDPILPATLTRGRQHFVYDAARLSTAELPEFFEQSESAELFGGRAEVSMVTHAGSQYVVRTYHRGGLIASVSRRTYLWSGWQRSRPWCEWQLLAALYTDGLPVPRPIAARAVRRRLRYRAQLATALLPGTSTLTELLQGAALPGAHWRRIGATIARFHRWGADHADLNSDNLLLDAQGGIWMIDFDRGKRRTAPGAWCQRNLERLRHSMARRHSRQALHVSDADWQALLGGYRDSDARMAATDSSSAT